MQQNNIVKLLIIGTSLSGKTTLVRYLRTHTDLNILEIDEELTRLNKGEYPLDNNYKINVLTPQIVKGILSHDSVIFFTNTDYFTPEDLKKARSNGFKILQLSLSLEELRKRNKSRVENEGYSDLSKWFNGMLEYQTKVRDLGLVDLVLDANISTEKLANELISIYN